MRHQLTARRNDEHKIQTHTQVRTHTLCWCDTIQPSLTHHLRTRSPFCRITANGTSSSAVITKVGVCVCVCQRACMRLSSCGRAKAITWPLVPLITSLVREREKEREIWMTSIFLRKHQNYGKEILWWLLCGSVLTALSCKSVRVCVQIFVMDVTQEANGSQAKTTPQCNVCQTIPGHKCLLSSAPFNFSSLFIFVHPLLKVCLGRKLFFF